MHTRRGRRGDSVESREKLATRLGLYRDDDVRSSIALERTTVVLIDSSVLTDRPKVETRSLGAGSTMIMSRGTAVGS